MNNMGIKDETPDDKVIFDSVDARMKYSKGVPNADTEISTEIVKTESDLGIKLNDIQDKVRQIYERQLLMYDMLKDIFDNIYDDTEDKCQTCKHKDELPYGICTSCIFNTNGTYYYEKED